MERLQRKYAIIYIDREGETLKKDEDKVKSDFTTEDMVSDYYTQSGFLQWNFYLILPESLVSKKQKKEIESNDSYTRKYVIPDTALESFVEDHFPILKGKVRKQVKLVKGDSYVDAITKALNVQRKNGVELVELHEGCHRDYSLDFSLKNMDALRARLIFNPELQIIFYTHISNEFSLAEKKFKLFTTKRFK